MDTLWNYYYKFLYKLSPYETQTAFADDVAITTYDTRRIVALIPMYNKFSKATGLTVNQKKTHILFTTPPSQAQQNILSRSPWNTVKFVLSAKYLGITMGKD